MSIDRKALKNVIRAVARERGLLDGIDLVEFTNELIDRMREEFDCVNEDGSEDGEDE
jgi:hypothetical protein